MKPSIVITSESYLSEWLVTLLKKQFEIEFYDSSKTYKKSDLYYYANHQSSLTTDVLTRWPGKIVHESFYESLPFVDTCHIDNAGNYRITARDFIWWEHCHSWYQKGYRNNFARGINIKFFLLLMNLKRYYRDWLFNLTSNMYHDHCLYSYIARNKRLDGDAPAQWDHGSLNDYINMDWYDQTCFSLVSESKVSGNTFISEKIYKPLAFGHPFIVYGTKDTLSLLKLQGFETFESVIDESYDSLPDGQRHKKIEQELERLFDLFKQDQLFRDKQIADILEHNHHHFFNIAHVDNLMGTQILEPILEYYHTT
jgi:hypothetical protein